MSTGIAAVTSTVLLALTTYTKENDLGQLAQKHAQTAGDLWYIREAYLSLLTDITDKAVNIDNLREKRDQLQADLKSIYKAAPRTISKAYKRAQNALKLDEELTFSEEEIDDMLPPHLRKNSLA